MRSRIATALLLVGVVGAFLALTSTLGALRLPGDQQGYAPAQPIAFSHRLHAGELQIDCLYCHFGAEKSRHAGIPAESVCMNCHKIVTAPLGAIRAEDEQARKESRKARPVVSPELRKLYTAMALDDRLQPDPEQTPKPIEWVRVHSVPDFVYFDHRAHVMAGVACQRCHGPVETMERVH
ncbi:MAG: cytochrome C, partial [Planctomycetes bacterium]|nr:cytochrome C [Planctomycetota bacterium]